MPKRIDNFSFFSLIIILVAILFVFGGHTIALASLTPQGPVSNVKIMSEYFDQHIPGFDICSQLRHLTEPSVSPTVTPPYEVGLFSASSSSNVSGSTINGSTATTATTTQGSIFQKWFIDSCVMDGYLTAVKHVDTIHRFEIEGSQFADKLKKAGWSDKQIKAGVNLGQLFEEALMEVTRMPEKGMRVDRKDLQEASLKDFFLILKDSNEQFMTDLMRAIAEKEKLNLNNLKEYELAKIEKAREDVNKLTYEVYRELKEEPLVYNKGLAKDIIRSAGLRINETSNAYCPFGVKVDGHCLIIKREGRIVRNIDDYIYEEPIQKARDFLMCFLAPWRHFPLGEDYYFASTQKELDEMRKDNGLSGSDMRDGTTVEHVLKTPQPWCGREASETIKKTKCQTECKGVDKQGSLDFSKIQKCRKCIRDHLDERCNTQKICEKAREEADKKFTYQYTRPDGSTAKATGRPDLFEATVNPNTGKSQTFEDYKKLLCPSDQLKEDIKRDFLMELARKYKFLYNAPPEHWYYEPYSAATGGDPKKCALILGSLGYDVEGIVEDNLSNPLAKNAIQAYKKYQETVWRADLPIAVAYRPDPTDKDYNELNSGTFKNSGYGLQSFIQNTLDKIISNYQQIRTSEYVAGQGIRPEKYLIGFPDDRTNKYYFIDTENIISPAVFTQDKIAAATQAQFDLAQKAFKQYPENPFGGKPSCPDPRAKGGAELTMAEYQAIKADPTKLEHGWYLVNKAPPGKKKDLVCIFPQFNDLTGSIFGEITRSPRVDITKIKELPAPWEDTGNYMKIPQSYKQWYEGTMKVQIGTDKNGKPIYQTLSGQEAGIRKAPPDFSSPDFAKKYSNLSKAYPDIYKKAYGDNVPFPKVSPDYYTNKWYKDMTQIYEKPMSEILRTWFKEE